MVGAVVISEVVGEVVRCVDLDFFYAFPGVWCVWLGRGRYAGC